MFPPHDAVNDALLRRVEEAEHGDDAGNLRLCERGFRGVRVVVGGVVVGGVFRGSGRGIADGWRRRPLARFARDGGGRLDGRGGGEDLASGVPVKRIVAVPSRRGCPEDESFIERGEGCASSSAFFLRYRAAARVVEAVVDDRDLDEGRGFVGGGHLVVRGRKIWDFTTKKVQKPRTGRRTDALPYKYAVFARKRALSSRSSGFSQFAPRAGRVRGMPPKRKRRGSAGGDAVVLPRTPGLRSDLECTVCG